MAKDIMKDLTEEWYSDSEATPESTDEIIDDELLEMHILYKTRGTIFSGDGSVTVEKIDKKQSK